MTVISWPFLSKLYQNPRTTSVFRSPEDSSAGKYIPSFSPVAWLVLGFLSPPSACPPHDAALSLHVAFPGKPPRFFRTVLSLLRFLAEEFPPVSLRLVPEGFLPVPLRLLPKGFPLVPSRLLPEGFPLVPSRFLPKRFLPVPSRLLPKRFLPVPSRLLPEGFFLIPSRFLLIPSPGSVPDCPRPARFLPADCFVSLYVFLCFRLYILPLPLLPGNSLKILPVSFHC